jgi:hypothetical protein
MAKLLHRRRPRDHRARLGFDGLVEICRELDVGPRMCYRQSPIEVRGDEGQRVASKVVLVRASVRVVCQMLMGVYYVVGLYVVHDALRANHGCLGLEQQSVAERDRRGQDPIGSGGGEREASAREERQYEDRHRRHRDPQRRTRCARRVPSDEELEHARDCQERDQQFEPVSARDVSDPDHLPNVAPALLKRLLPE